MMRVGQGYDAHVWSEDDRPLVIGGVHFAGFRGLKGHSDADVVTHAVIDAILGALGMGDIGQIFPDTDPENEAASSIEMLSEVKKLMADQGWVLINADCTVITDAPHIAEVKDEMERNLSDAAGGRVTVCGKRTEGIGALGRGEGVVAMAVALLENT